MTWYNRARGGWHILSIADAVRDPAGWHCPFGICFDEREDDVHYCHSDLASTPELILAPYKSVPFALEWISDTHPPE